MSAARRALARQAFRDGRTRTFSFAALFALVALVQPLAYRHSYPTLQDRIGFARSFGDNTAVRLFYGAPHDLLTVGGYSGWRVGGFMSIFAGVWGLLAAVRALRAEEESGRQELVLAGVVCRREAFAAALLAIAAGAAVLWVALFAGLLAGGLDAGGSAYLALAAISPVPVFVGVGAIASQLAPTRRVALELASAVLLVTLVARVVSDTSHSLDWLRWATPLGWVEELRPFAGAQPAVLLLPLLASALLLAVALALASARDVGTGLLSARDSAPASTRLLGSTTAQALRDERGSLIAWLVGVGFFAAIVGLLSDTFSGGGISRNLQEQFRKVGGASLTTPSGALGFYFLFFVVVISLFACAQIAAIRREEADQRLETLFALPVSRRRWLAGRTAIAAGGAALLALGAGVLAWAGAAAAGAGVSLADMLGAGANCLPTALLFLGLGLLAFGGAPRASAGIAYGLVAGAFVWELFGAVLGAPSWTLDLSPFHHVGLVPAQPFKATAAVVMLAVAALAAVAATRLFERRDLTGS